MDIRDWMRHPLRCIAAVVDGRLHADCRGRIEITPAGRQALAAMHARNVVYLDGGEAV